MKGLTKMTVQQLVTEAEKEGITLPAKPTRSLMSASSETVGTLQKTPLSRSAGTRDSCTRKSGESLRLCQEEGPRPGPGSIAHNPSTLGERGGPR